MAYLILTHPNTGQILPVTATTTTIRRVGRHAITVGEGLVMFDHLINQVSKQHAQIVRQGDMFFIRDGAEHAGASTNGTLLNGQRLGEQLRPLRDGDEVGLCVPAVIGFRFFARPAPSNRPTGPLLEGVPPPTIRVPPAGAELTPPFLSSVDVGELSSDSTKLGASAESRFRSLLDIMNSLGKALSLDDVLSQVLNSLFKLFAQADRGVIVLRTEEGGLESRWMKIRTANEEPPGFSRTVVQHVMGSKQATRLEDLPWPPSIEDSMGKLRVRSVMCAPLLDSRGTALGAIQLDTADRQKQFLQEDLELFATVSAPAGIAIDNARLHERALRRKEIERDLEVAHGVQLAFLPQRVPQVEGYEFFHYYQPMIEVGGDYYDYIPLSDGRLAIMVADVLGHGVAAAMMMARLSAEAKFCLASERHPAQAVSRLNQGLHALQIDERMVTLLLVVLDPRRHQATIVNAGHPPPIWRRVDATLDEPGDAQRGYAVGVVEGFTYEQATIQLAPGDLLAFYTDGVPDAMDPQDQRFGTDKIRGHLRHAGDPVELATVGRGLVAEGRQHVGSGVQIDDMCFVMLRRKST
jgi:phosphoserine phosphatase RsbU/P